MSISREEFAANCKYEDVLKNFYSIAKVYPRMPGRPEAISAYLVNRYTEMGLEAYVDDTCNVVVRKPASPGYENAPPVLITAHMDMVCEKAPGVDHDFFNEPLTLIREPDGKIHADGTTLGADDGIGCAYLMTLLETGTEHPEIEAFFSVDEESDMKGALNLDYSKLRSKVVLNLDGRPLCAAAAGEIEIHSKFPVERVAVKDGYKIYSLKVSGLFGGHAGVDALRERGNAITLLARCLSYISSEVSYQLLRADCTSTRTSGFARDAECEIALPDGSGEIVRNLVAQFADKIKREFEDRDTPVLTLETYVADGKMAFSDATTEKLLKYLLLIPDGVYLRDHKFDGHLMGSSNTGVLLTEGDTLHLATLIRFHSQSLKDLLYQKFQIICELLDIELTVDHDLPEFPYTLSDSLRAITEDIYKGMEIDICDGCIECGIFAEKIKDSVVLSLALPHYFPHSPNEHFYVDECMQCYENIVEVVRRLKELAN